ncbi:hypothetical protein [Treponema sp.]|uniref:hypothetical protein n=1 Tax=Treponema sp. TaxID=166 RepID=UPI00389015D2
MKIFRNLFFTVAAFFIFSCSQLNLKNPVGAVQVSLPSSSRKIVEDGQTVNSFENINYIISLYSSSGAFIDSKSATEGSSVTFSELQEGSYVVKGICYAGGDGIAAGSASAEVKGGEVIPVNLVLSYNRPDKIDVNRSSIRYTGKTEFSNEDEMMSYVNGNFKNFLSAEVVFTNGWTETVTDSSKFSAERTQTQDVQTRGESMAVGGSGAPQDVIVSGERTLYQFKVTCTLSESKKYRNNCKSLCC